jgi:hypothetical protein
MTKEVKKELLDILNFYKDLLGVDKTRVEQLIGEVNRIGTRYVPDEKLSDKINSFILQCCDILGYVPNEKNNLSRDPELVAERFAILRKADVEFNRSFAVDIAAMEVFGKHRTTLSHWRKTSDNLIAIKDVLFFHKYMQL